MAISNPSGYYIDKITLPTGTTYALVDATARSTIDNISTTVTSISSNLNALSTSLTSLSSTVDSMSKYTQYLGVTTTSLTDNVSTCAVVVIGGSSVTATKGSIVINGSQEFIYDGTKWQLFGDLSALSTQLGSMAYTNTSQVKYIKFDSVNYSTANVSSTGVFTPSGSVTLNSTTVIYAKITSTATTPANTANYWVYTPEGTVTVTPSITGGTNENVLTGVTGINALVSITTADPATAAAFQYATVDNHVLILNQILSSSNNTIASTSTANVVKTIGTLSATTTFTGATIYSEQMSLTIPETYEFNGTQGNITVTSGPVVTSITSTTSTATVIIET